MFFSKKVKVVRYKNSGFTLIELLVVISIIGLLSSIVLASLSSARTKSRDAQRTLSIKQLQTALELYYDSNNSQYPTSPDVAFPGPLTSSLTPSYISLIPTDPGNGSNVYRYYTASLNPAPFYAVYVPYETKTACYVCGGSLCQAGNGWWGVNICR